MNSTLIKYDNCFDGTINIYPNGTMLLSTYGGYQKTRGRWAYLSDSPFHYAVTNSYSQPTNVNKVFVTPEVRTARDIIRKSYQIVRDPERADAVVIPDEFDIYSQTCRIVVKNEDRNDLYLLDIMKRSQVHQEYLIDIEAHKDIILNWLNGQFCGNRISIYHEDKLEPFSVQFVHKVNEYENILNNTYPSRKYILETALDLSAATTISPETLLIWLKMDDLDLFQKSVSMSDWKKYPHTINFLLEKKGIWYCGYKRDFQLIIDAIRFYDYKYNENYNDVIIEPDDWNMLQKFLMHINRVDVDKGGFVKTEDRIYSNENLKYARKRICIAPLLIDHPMTFRNLKGLASKS